MNSLHLPHTTIEDVKMIIFDKDGTLIDIHYYWCSMIEFRAEFFINSLEDEFIDKELLYNDLVDSMGVDLQSKKMKPQGPVGIKPRGFIENVALDTILKYTPNYTLERVEDIFTKVDDYSKSQLQKIVQPLEGVEWLLESLQANGIAASIATTDLSTRAILAMENLGFKSFFTQIAGADLVQNAKPSADLVEYILKSQHLSKDEVIVVGDSMADLNMAKNAGCRFLGVKTGLFTKEFLTTSEYLVDDLREVKVD